MSKRRIFIFVSLVTFVVTIFLYISSGSSFEGFSERVKVSLRNVGHQLLLENNDSTSLVQPIIELERVEYQLSFQNKLAIEPSNLISVVEQNIKAAELPTNYLVEVFECSSKEVVYSYKMKQAAEKSIIPCRGRNLPVSCYKIRLKFSNIATPIINRKILIVIGVLSMLVFIFVLFYKRDSTHNSNLNPISNNENKDTDFVTIGSFQFYAEQHKLVKQATEIKLSKKECELLSIFINKPNQIITRDELTKKVWEDNGVIVGRSLDTYISKLRKKLITDTTVKLTNVHGVGYKLEL